MPPPLSFCHHHQRPKCPLCLPPPPSSHTNLSLTRADAAPLRVAVRLPTGPLERDERDPALWDHAKAVEWLKATASTHPEHMRFGGGAEVDAAEMDAAEMDAAAVDAADGHAGEGGARDGAGGGGGGGGSGLDDPNALLGVAGAFLPRVAIDGPFDAEAVLPPGMSGLDLCRLPEPELHVRVKRQFPGKVGAALAARLHEALWMLICDAKKRRRRPNGNLVTDEEEAEEARAAEAAVARRNALWKQREEQMAAASTLDAANEMASRM